SNSENFTLNLNGIFQNKLIIIMYLFTESLFYFKDGLSGKSLGKKIFNLKVVEINTLQTVSPLKSVFRNLITIFFPIEILFLLINSNKRLGDYFCGTTVIKDEGREKVNFHFINYCGAFLISLVFPLVFYLPFLAFNFSPENSNGNQIKKTEKYKEIEESTVNIIDTLKIKYNDEFDNVLLTVRKSDGNGLIIKGALILKFDAFGSGKIMDLERRVKYDITKLTEGRNYYIDISIVFSETDPPKIRKLIWKKRNDEEYN
ncbi:MAG: RDD family protein, partial [Bacteroidota bacterium]